MVSGVRSTPTILTRAVHGALAGLTGGVVFGVLMAMMGMLPMVAMLVGSTSPVVGALVHLVISAGLGVLLALVIDLDDRDGVAPVGVVGTPTFLIGKAIVAVGNPGLRRVLDTLDGIGSVVVGVTVRAGRGTGLDEGHHCLSEVALFQDLSSREMAATAAAAPRRSVAAGQVFYDPGRPTAVLFIVRSGRFRLFRVLADGRTVTTAVPGPGAAFGQMDLLGMRMGGTWAQALEPGDPCLMSRGEVRAMLLGEPRIATRVAEQFGARIVELEQRLADLMGKSAVERTAHTLLVLIGPGPPDVEPAPVRLTHEQLAGRVGATRERTTTAPGELAERRLVSLHRGRIRVRDRTGLAALADGAARTPTGGRRSGRNTDDDGGSHRS